jgi:hypothetical protein
LLLFFKKEALALTVFPHQMPIDAIRQPPIPQIMQHHFGGFASDVDIGWV